MQKKKNILIVEDEEDIQQLVSYNLIKAGFTVGVCDSGETALELIRRESFDLVLLDLMLPGIGGLEVCKALKADDKTRDLPVIMLTAKGEEADIVVGLDLGADDYVGKPFSVKVLVSRVHAVLRRNEKGGTAKDENDRLVIGGLEVDPGRHTVTVNGRLLYLTPTEFSILELLVQRAGWVFTRQQIIDAVRGYDYMITPRSIDVQVFGLRKKLGGMGHNIETIRGVGYRFKER